MRVPKDDGTGRWARELIEECYSSHEARCDQIRQWKSYFYTGTGDGTPAVYNRCYSHVDRLASLLYSPVDTRFDIEFDETEKSNIHAMGRASARYFNRELHRCGVDLKFAAGVNWGLVKGACILKTIPEMGPNPDATKETPDELKWIYKGLQSWVIQPEQFGVLREDVTELDDQDAFVCSQYLTRNAFRRSIHGHPEEKEILREVYSAAENQDNQTKMDEDFFHQIIVGGNTPVSTQGSTGQGKVQVFGVPQPFLDPKVAKDLIRVDELWVKDDARQDYTTFRLVGNVLVEGKLIQRNLHKIQGEHGFTKVCPNEIEGYFWGMSELSQIYRLQDMLNDQVDTLRRLMRLKAEPPRAMIGFSGMTAEKYKVLNRPRGFVTEDAPNAKIETLAPEIPQELFTMLERTERMFDDVAGFTPIMMGQGETGVRSQAQAQTLARNSSPRMRDRALLVERQCIDLGDTCFNIMQAKNAKIFLTDDKGKNTGEFTLDQLPDESRVSIDSHTSSPAFQEDAQAKADRLLKAGAIDAEAYIRLTHPPHEDSLAAQARKRAEEKAKLEAQIAQTHPELLFGKGKPGPKKR